MWQCVPPQRIAPNLELHVAELPASLQPPRNKVQLFARGNAWHMATVAREHPRDRERQSRPSLLIPAGHTAVRRNFVGNGERCCHTQFAVRASCKARPRHTPFGGRRANPFRLELTTITLEYKAERSAEGTQSIRYPPIGLSDGEPLRTDVWHSDARQHERSRRDRRAPRRRARDRTRRQVELKQTLFKSSPRFTIPT